MDDPKFKYFQEKVISILDSMEKQENSEKKEVKKSLLEAEEIAKGGKGLPVGTVREWKGKKYVKIAPKKWKPKYDDAGRGAKMAIAAIKKKASACTTSQELLQLVQEYRDRFSDKNGHPLPIVKELSDYVSKRNDEIESGKREEKEKAAESKKEDKKLSNGKTIKEMREKYGIKVDDDKTKIEKKEETGNNTNQSEDTKGNKSAEKDGLERVTELIESLNKDLPNQEITLSDKDFIEKNWGENKNYVIRTFKKEENTARQEATIAKEKGQKDVAEYQEGKSRYYNYIASNLNHILVENQINGRMGTVYKQIERDPMLAVEFLLQKHSGYIENVFSYKINGIEKDVGFGFGDSNFGLKKQIEKHIIEQTDFETVEEMMKKIDNVLKFGKENNKNQKADRIRVEYNNYAVILSIDEDYGNVFISSFKKIYPNKQVRSKQEQIKKMEEISNRHPNFFNQEGSLVPDSISENITQSNSNVNKNEIKKSITLTAPEITELVSKSLTNFILEEALGM